MLASQDERYINIVKIEDKPGQCPVGVIFMFYKKKTTGGRSSGWAQCYNEGGISKAEGSGVCTNCLERKGSPVGSQHLIIVLEKSGAGSGC